MKPRKRGRNRGGILPLAAITLTVLLGMAALAIDLAALYATRQNARLAADAAALGAGGLLPNASQATATANALLTANGATAAQWTVNPAVTQVTLDNGTVVPVTPGEAITVSGALPVPLNFSSAVGGPSSLSASASATVMLQTACSLPSGSPVVPLGIPDTDPSIAAILAGQPPQPGVMQNTSVSLNVNDWSAASKSPLTANADPIQITTTANFYPAFDSLTTQSLASGQTIPAQTGTVNKQIKTYLGARLSPSNAQFTHAYLNYNAWFAGGQPTTDAHLIVLPIVHESNPSGPGSVTLSAFAVFYLDQVNAVNPNNSKLLAQGRFVGLTLPGAQTGVCTAAGSLAPRLVQ